jgi:hypothetical protein
VQTADEIDSIRKLVPVDDSLCRIALRPPRQQLNWISSQFPGGLLLQLEQKSAAMLPRQMVSAIQIHNLLPADSSQPDGKDFVLPALLPVPSMRKIPSPVHSLSS